MARPPTRSRRAPRAAVLDVKLAPKPVARRPVVLIADDDEATRDMYAIHFAHAGYRVTTATDGNEAIFVALSERPDVIVLDLLMPNLDGCDAAALLRAYPSTRDTPIIACTGFEHAEARMRLNRIDAVTILRKPCPIGQLHRAVQDALRDANRARGAVTG